MTEIRTALITGASRGLGQALAEALAASGTRVVLVARGRDDLERVVAGIQATGGEAHALVADVGDPDVAHAIAAQATSRVGELDLLVHNASTLGPVPLRPLLDTSEADFRQALEVNLLGPFRLTRALAGGMQLRQRGTLLFISSDAAVEPYADWGAYGTSKAGLAQLARIWAAELEPSGVRVLSVDPGEMDTRMHAEALPGADRSLLADPRDVAQRLLGLLAQVGGAA